MRLSRRRSSRRGCRRRSSWRRGSCASTSPTASTGARTGNVARVNRGRSARQRPGPLQCTCMTIRQQIAEMLKQPRTMSSVAHELKLTRDEVEDHLKHLLKSAKAADQDVRVEPARCRSCGHTFGRDKLTKPSKCPECKSTHLYEPLVQIKG